MAHKAKNTPHLASYRMFADPSRLSRTVCLSPQAPRQLPPPSGPPVTYLLSRTTTQTQAHMGEVRPYSSGKANGKFGDSEVVCGLGPNLLGKQGGIRR